MAWRRFGDLYVNRVNRVVITDDDLKDIMALREDAVKGIELDVVTLDLRKKRETRWHAPQEELQRIWDEYPTPRVGKAEGLEILWKDLGSQDELHLCLLSAANYKLYAADNAHRIPDYKPMQFQVWAKKWRNWLPDKDAKIPNGITDYGQLPF
jgi:hypothetical protein